MTVYGGRFKFIQPRFAAMPTSLGDIHPKIAAMNAFGQRTSLVDEEGNAISPADPRVGIVDVNSKENVEIYRGIHIQKMPNGKLVTREKFPGDRRMGGIRPNRRQTETPLYANSIAMMRRQIDQQLAPLEGIDSAGERLLWLGIGFGLGILAGTLPRNK